MDLSNVFEYGVGIAGIGGMVIIVKIFMKFIGNHMESSTKASQKLADSIETLSDWLKKE